MNMMNLNHKGMITLLICIVDIFLCVTMRKHPFRKQMEVENFDFDIENVTVKYVSMQMEEYNERAEAIDMRSHELHESPCVVPLCGLGSQFLVTEDNILQVFVRSGGAHKIIEDIIWRNQLEERQRRMFKVSLVSNFAS